LVPLIDTMIAVTTGHLRPFWKKPTIERMKAVGSKIQPTINAPGMQAKMNPTTAMAHATHATTCGFAGLAGGGGGGGV
jgi:hypothetical protein